MATIPEVQTGIIPSMMVNVAGPQADPKWIVDMYKKVQLENPVIAEYLRQVMEKYDKNAMTVGLVVYKLIESQMIVNDLEELMGE